VGPCEAVSMTFLQLLGGSSRFCQRVCQQPTSIHRVGLEEGAAAQRAARMLVEPVARSLVEVGGCGGRGLEEVQMVVLRVAVMLQDAMVPFVERALLQLPPRRVHRLD